MPVSAPIDPSLHWSEHFVRYGFAVLRQQVSRAFAVKALERIRTHHVEGPGKELPFDQWTMQNVKLCGKVPGDPVLDQVFEQPGVREIITTMFGTCEVGAPTGWNGQIDYQIFLNPFNPEAPRRELKGGHIDFGGNIIPVFGDAFVMQVALHETEPFGGNITVIPGSHRLVQQRAIRDPHTQFPHDFHDFLFTEPYEFVAQPGDVFLMHHLMFHSGNPCVGDTRKPRIALHCQVHRSTFLTRADPADATNPPWVKSFTLNGFHEDPNDEKRYLDFCRNKKAMWGVWSSDDGRINYKLYTGSDGSLHAKLLGADGGETLGRSERFDGTRMRFVLSGAAMEAAGGGGVVTASRSACRAELELDPADGERMVARLTPEDGGEPVTLRLRRTQVFTTRLKG